MKQFILTLLFAFLGFTTTFASFPVETQSLILDADPESFKLDTWGFIIGILTTPLLLFYGLPCALLFINKKHFRKSLALGWIAGLILIILIVLAAETDFNPFIFS